MKQNRGLYGKLDTRLDCQHMGMVSGDNVHVKQPHFKLEEYAICGIMKWV